MASTVSSKSDTLDSFSLPRFKWNSATATATATPTLNNHNNSPPLDATLCLSSSPASDNADLSGNVDSLSTAVTVGFSTPSSSSPSHFLIPKSHDNPTLHGDLIAGTSEDKSALSNDPGKVLLKIRFGRSNPDDAAATQDSVSLVPDDVAATQASISLVPDDAAATQASIPLVPDEPGQSKPKTWDLRTRKASTEKLNANGSAPEVPTELVSKAAKLTEKKKKKKKTKKEKLKPNFSISLSKDDIAEDMLAMIGKKPCARPKKRAKNVQRQLDGIFPGLRLHSITPNSYRVRGRSSRA